MQIKNKSLNPESQNFNSDQFSGIYTEKGNGYFQNNDSSLLVKVCARNVSTPLKPRFYVMHRTNQGRFEFLTSLYPKPGKSDLFIAEIQHRYYVVNYTGDTLKIDSK